MSIRYLFNPDLFDVRKPEPNTTLWRYTDVPKFISLLARKALFFCRLDHFDDPFEGSMPRALAVVREDRQKRSAMALMYDQTPLVLTWRRNTIINCWHIGEAESAAMWSLYARDNQGLAIRSTFKRMTESLPRFSGADEEEPEYSITPAILHVGAGLVDYIDFADEHIDLNIRRLPFYKRRSFEHERELRLVCTAHPYMGDPTEESCFPQNGDYVPLDIKLLIKDVFVAPQAPGWFAEVVQSVINRFGFSFQLRHSSLDQDPVF
jgi:hypothetical protein